MDSNQLSNTPAPNILASTSRFPSFSRRKKIIAGISLVTLIIGIVSSVVLIQRQLFLTSHAWDCSKYAFEVTITGSVVAKNDSGKVEPAQKVSVSIDGTPKGIFDVPTLAIGEHKTIGAVTVPDNGGFTWTATGESDCANSGSYPVVPTVTPIPPACKACATDNDCLDHTGTLCYNNFCEKQTDFEKQTPQCSPTPTLPASTCGNFEFSVSYLCGQGTITVHNLSKLESVQSTISVTTNSTPATPVSSFTLPSLIGNEFKDIGTIDIPSRSTTWEITIAATQCKYSHVYPGPFDACITPTVTTSPSPSPTTPVVPSPTPTDSPNNPGRPNDCGGTCGTDANCQADLTCYKGFCRNPNNPASTTCSSRSTSTGGSPITPTPVKSLPVSGASDYTWALGVGGILILGAGALLLVL